MTFSNNSGTDSDTESDTQTSVHTYLTRAHKRTFTVLRSEAESSLQGTEVERLSQVLSKRYGTLQVRTQIGELQNLLCMGVALRSILNKD